MDFNKYMQISEELARFTGWDRHTHRTRVEVTRYICNYIRENNLQKGIEIRVNDDPRLRRLLCHDNTGSITYYGLQAFLKPHLTKPGINQNITTIP